MRKTVAIVGRPNVGKSTLLNRLIGQKISIVSRKAQTTGHRVTGVLTEGASQFIFVDTPGFQTRHKNALNRAMNRTVTQVLADVDLVLFVIESGRFGPEDEQVVKLLPERAKVILVVNKVDLLEDKARMLPFLQKMSAGYPFAEIVPVSAEKGQIEFKDSAGGLATGMSSFYQERNAVWIGWPGRVCGLPTCTRPPPFARRRAMG